MNALLNLHYWLFIVAVSLLGTLPNLVAYYLGREGSAAVFKRYPHLQTSHLWDRVNRWFQRWGSRTLLLAFIPALATALSATAGIFGINRSIFLTYVITAKVMRNWVLLLLILNIARSFEVL
ncbi:MAG: VTT domain-containing protein [Anaerolineae bacterium]|nr:VTT domain-containing protein [Anaerolineae bacterium]MCO5206921.1 VTT domain-containing protein [Anaerolineae bacterium]